MNLPGPSSQEKHRKIYEICCEFEDAWLRGERPPISEWCSKYGDIDPGFIESELSEIQKELEERETTPRLSNQFRDDRYKFVEEIARGGSAVVWRVHDLRLQRETAIKYLLDRHDNQAMRSRLEREARICAKLAHPGIVPIHELDHFIDGRPFVCMRLVEGSTFLQLLNAKPPIPMHSAISIFTKVCQATAFAHSRGVIHRDLKPSNIMVGVFGEVQVMDWGLAKETSLATNGPELAMPGTVEILPQLADGLSSTESTINAMDGFQSDSTMHGSVVGTLAYMSPEQARGHVAMVDQRSDVFSLGAILCRLLIGRPPIVGENQESLLDAAQSGSTQAAIRSLSQSKHKQLAKLAIECLASNPEKRPRDAGVVAQRLEQIVASQRRRSTRLAVAGALLGIVTLSVGIASKNWRTRPKTLVTDSRHTDADNWDGAGLPDAEHIVDLIQANKIELPLRVYPAVLTKYPNHVELRRQLTRTLINEGRYLEAEEVTYELIKLDESSGVNYQILADTFYFRGKFETALELYVKAQSYENLGTRSNPKAQERIELIRSALENRSFFESFDWNEARSLTLKELSTLADKAEVLGQLETAIRLHDLRIELASTDFDRTLWRHDGMAYFIGRQLSNPQASADQRNWVCGVAVRWLSKQLEFAKSEIDRTNLEKCPTTPLLELLNVISGEHWYKPLRMWLSDPKIDAKVLAEYRTIVNEAKRLKWRLNTVPNSEPPR